MTRLNALLPAALLVVLLAYLVPGCDDLITETIINDIAGHPSAEFSVTPDSGCEPLSITLNDESNGPRDRAVYYFYKGNTVTPFDSVVVTPVPADTAVLNADTVFTFTEAGVYAIRLTITNSPDSGLDSEMKKRAVIVGTSVLDFGASDTIICPGDEVTFQPNVNDWGAVSSWNWDFGDNGTSTDSIPSHTYADTGAYTVTLTVDGPCGQKQIVDSALIKVLPCPTIVFAADTTVGCLPLTVHFSDQTSIDSGTGFVINGRAWSVGTAGNPGSTPTITTIYNTAGVYDIHLTLELKGVFYGDTITFTRTDSLLDYITVWDSTSADFHALSPAMGCYTPSQQFQVLFAPDYAGDFDSLVWTFGDGTSWIDRASGAAAKTPVHAYTTPGVYDVRLNAYGPCGDAVTTRSSYVTLSAPLHQDSIAFSITADSANATGYYFTFADITNGMVLTRQWAFGDNQLDVSPGNDTVYHRYDTLATGVVSDSFFVVMSAGNMCDTLNVVDTIIITPLPARK